MKDRRQFLKEAATGAVLMSSGGRLGMTALLAQSAPARKSKVLIARDPQLRGTGTELDEKRVMDLLARAITAYTGHDKPVEAWESLVPTDKVIGLKVNGLGGKAIATNPLLIMAVAEQLQQAGVKPGNIVVWDQNTRFLEACGMTVSTDPNKIRCIPADSFGFEDEASSFGVANIRLSKLLTHECAAIINLPILKDHRMSGVTFALKNMYGTVDRPNSLHNNNCNPAIADLNAIPVYRSKIRITIGDALTAMYDGGPVYRPETTWYPNAIIVGEDRVALDTVAWDLIEHKRAEAGLQTLEAAGRPPGYIAVAADAQHNLGTNDPHRIHRVEV
jgi:uncharacterized protein (DUF362 family)